MLFSPTCMFPLLRYHKSEFYASNLSKICPLDIYNNQYQSCLKESCYKLFLQEALNNVT